MGVYLSKPNTQKHSDDGGNLDEGKVKYGVTEMQGWRMQMEDAHLMVNKFGERPIALYGVFDGHGGSAVSTWVAQHFESVFESELRTVKANGTDRSKDPITPGVAAVCEALEMTFLKLDENMQTKENRRELSEIHKSVEASDKEKPPSLLDVLQQSNSCGGPTFRIYEESGHRYFQMTNDEDDHENRIEEIEEGVEEVVEAIPEEDQPIAPPPEDVKENVPDAPEGEKGVVEAEEEEEDLLMNKPPWAPENCGTAAVVAAVVWEDDVPTVVVANSGDSRAVLSRAKEAIHLSEDHKPHLPVEMERIRNAGGTVIQGRIDGNLNLSRTLGDLHYKSDTAIPPEAQKITALPDLRWVELCSSDEFLLIACDGIWDCLTNQEAVTFIHERLYDEDGNLRDVSLSSICEEMCDLCVADNPVMTEGVGCDNMTVSIVLLSEELKKTADNRSVKIYPTKTT